MALIKFTAKQQEAADAVASEQYTFILYGGAMGGGKTWWGLLILLILCRLFPKSRWCVIREDLEKIRTTTIPSFKQLGAPGHLRESPYEYTHPNGSVILFKGENWDKDKELQWLKGLEVNGFLFEEINECQRDTLDMAFGRAGRWKVEGRMPKPLILATCNPSKNWVKELVYDRWENKTLPNTWLYVPAKLTDNEHLTEEYRENLKNMPTYKYEVLVNGNWNISLKTGSEFYKCFDPEKHIGTVKYNPTIPLHISWDDNVNPYLPCGIFQIYKTVDITGKQVGWDVHMIDIIVGKTPNNTVEKVCQEFIRRYPAHDAGVILYGDATANKEDTKLEKGYNFYRLIVDYLARYRPQNRVLNHNPSVVMRGQWINTVLEKELDGIRFLIGDKCTEAIDDFTNLKEAADGTKLKQMETDPKTLIRYQKYGHFTDLTDYFFVSAFGSEFVKYQKGGRQLPVKAGKNLSKNSY